MSKEFCFVIMPFSAELKGVYDNAIRPAVKACGLECIRVDEVDGSGNIVRNIVEHIAMAKVVIADFTGKNPNVFYELGIAHTLGNNVVVIAQDIREDVPFDVNNYKVIKYKDTIGGGDKLRADLIQSVETIDDWGQKPSNPVQDFLPEENKPIPKQEFEKLTKAKAKIEQDLHHARSKLIEKSDLHNTINKLKEENEKLKAFKEVFENIIKQSGISESDIASLVKKVQTLSEREKLTFTPLKK